MRFNKETLDQGSYKGRIRPLVKSHLSAYARVNSVKEKDRTCEAFAILLREMQATGRFNLSEWYKGRP